MRAGPILVCLLAAACGEAGPPTNEALESARAERDAAAAGGPGGGDESAAGEGGPADAASPDRDSDLVVPGGPFGPVAPDASAADLLALVGARDLALSPIDIGEGMCAAGARLFPGTVDEIEVAFTDSARSLAASAVASGLGSRWRTAEGIRVGTTLGEITERNGAPVTFTGFGWDRGGVVIGYGDGALAKYRDGTGFFLLLESTPDPTERELNGDRDVSSDNPLLAPYAIAVRRMEAQWRNPADTYDCEPDAGDR